MTAVREEGGQGLGEIGEGIKQRKTLKKQNNNKKQLIDADNSMVITRGKGRWGR